VIDSSIGIDPGPATGMCFLDYHEGRLVGRVLLQADGSTARYVLRAMLTAYYGGSGRRSASVERFVSGRSAGSAGADADVTRQLVMELTEELQLFGYSPVIRPAADVKPWATDKRLEAAGITGESGVHGKLRDAYDAARHALYGAKIAGITPDPLLRRKEDGEHASLQRP